MFSSYHEVVQEKLSDFYEQGVPTFFTRDLSLGKIQQPARSNLVTIITGVRRCGKTYRLYQEMQNLLDAGVGLSSILYFNFDDERLKPYETAILDDVVESFYARNPKAKTKGAYFFFDEIQEIPEWGAFMRRMVDTQVATIYATGSSSKMLSLQMASEFRGRALTRELFPMSFSEYVRFHDYDIPNEVLERAGEACTSSQRACLRNACKRYLEKGGFIAAQKLDSSDAVQLLQEYANRTVNYDVIERYAVGNPRAAALFLARCLASSGRELSVTKIHNEFKSRQIGVSRDMLYRLLDYYEESYLLFGIRNYSVALADNPRSAMKVYAVDPALLSAFSPAPSTDAGQRLETAAFNKLRRTAPSWRFGAISRAFVGEGSKRQEIDFVVGDALTLNCPDIVQVSLEMGDVKTRSREIRALETAMSQFATDSSTLVTLDEEGIEDASSGTVRLVPVWKWLLGK